MRLIYEFDDDQDFFEVILTEEEVYKIQRSEGVTKDFLGGYKDRALNVFVRKENPYE